MNSTLSRSSFKIPNCTSNTAGTEHSCSVFDGACNNTHCKALTGPILLISICLWALVGLINLSVVVAPKTQSSANAATHLSMWHPPHMTYSNVVGALEENHAWRGDEGLLPLIPN